MNIQIRYADKFDANVGCMTVRMPDWLAEQRAHQRAFYKLAAQHADQFDNREQIAQLRACIEQAIAEAKQEAEATEKGERRETARRAENRPDARVERYTRALADLDAAMIKYAKTSKR